jgi:hypothetical protein
MAFELAIDLVLRDTEPNEAGMVGNPGIVVRSSRSSCMVSPDMQMSDAYALTQARVRTLVSDAEDDLQEQLDAIRKYAEKVENGEVQDQ